MELDGGIKIYLREIGKTDLLTPEQEVELADRIKRGDPEARSHMIRANLRIRGVQADDQELEALVDLSTWDESCYEFAHFKDSELADAIMTVHTTINGWTRDELVGALSYWRGQKKDIKRAKTLAAALDFTEKTL